MANDTASLTALNDPELIARYQGGDPRALEVIISRYRRFARAKGRGYFLVGGDHDDIEQEALIGLYKAARDFRPGHQASFRSFAELCITRQIITAIKTATRQKHQPLNQCVSINASRRGGTDEGDDRSMDEVLTDPKTAGDPADQVIADERMTRMRDGMREVLSPLEVEVLRLYVAGKSYQEIGDELGRHTKSIDNALQRIKRKLDHHIETEAAQDLLVLA